jgi:hypothetical protein
VHAHSPKNLYSLLLISSCLVGIIAVYLSDLRQRKIFLLERRVVDIYQNLIKNEITNSNENMLSVNHAPPFTAPTSLEASSSISPSDQVLNTSASTKNQGNRKVEPFEQPNTQRNARVASTARRKSLLDYFSFSENALRRVSIQVNSRLQEVVLARSQTKINITQPQNISRKVGVITEEDEEEEEEIEDCKEATRESEWSQEDSEHLSKSTITIQPTETPDMGSPAKKTWFTFKKEGNTYASPGPFKSIEKSISIVKSPHCPCIPVDWVPFLVCGMSDFKIPEVEKKYRLKRHQAFIVTTRLNCLVIGLFAVLHSFLDTVSYCNPNMPKVSGKHC